MCGCTEAKIDGFEIDFYMGYLCSKMVWHNGPETFDSVTIRDDPEKPNQRIKPSVYDINKITTFFNKFSKEQLIDILKQFLVNGEED